MEDTIHIIYFSPAFSTRETVRLFVRAFGGNIIEHDITQDFFGKLSFSAGDMVIFAMPVYAGRLPVIAAESIQRIKGNNTPAITLVVYGNRDYDDALIELHDITKENGFKVIGAAAFIARHSIFPLVAANRPDEKDKEIIRKFAEKCREIYQTKTYLSKSPALNVKGNKPYKDIPPKGPFFPTADDQCIACGICAESCPGKAIPEENPKETNGEICIRCTRCIVVCPEEARSFRGPVYPIAHEKFKETNSERKEPEVFNLS